MLKIAGKFKLKVAKCQKEWESQIEIPKMSKSEGNSNWNSQSVGYSNSLNVKKRGKIQISKIL